MRSLGLRPLFSILTLLALATATQAQDLHIKKNVSVGGNVVSTSDTSIKGARTRELSQGPSGGTVTLRQCDLKRTVTINEQMQTYHVANDPQDAAAARAAALATGASVPETTGGKIDVKTTVTDTGERKQLYGYSARHLKVKVTQESSQNACTQVHQSFDIDGWYADVSKELAGCNQLGPPVRLAQGCQDAIMEHHSGNGKPGYPLSQTITMPGADGTPTTVTIAVAELSKQTLEPALFDVPEGYRQVNSLAELNGMGTQPQMAQQAPAYTPPAQQMTQGSTPGRQPAPSAAQMMNPATQAAMQKNAWAQAQQMGLTGAMPNMGGMGQGGMPGMGMPGMAGNQPAGAPMAAPQALGPKAPGKIRVGVAPPDAQVGQGSNAGADYSTPIRNAMVALMSGPAVEIAALDSHIAMQLQAEAQQKQCDYVLYSSVAVKRATSGGFGKFMKMASPVASMTPVGMMAHGVGSAAAATAASAAASAAAQAAQQQAISQLAAFNGQIKSKDDVSVQYQLVQTGQTAPVVQNSLQGKAKSDGEDVLTPLLTQTATTVLTQVSKK
jgi:hypothetical protein